MTGENKPDPKQPSRTGETAGIPANPYKPVSEAPIPEAPRQAESGAPRPTRPGSADGSGKESKPGRDWFAWSTTILSTVAALASAITAYLAYDFTHTQADRDKRLVSIREIEQFESRIARLGHPMSCVAFVRSLDPTNPVRELLSLPVDATELSIDRAQHTHLSVCLSGLNVPPIAVPARPATATGTIPVSIQPEIAQILYNFTIDFINAHDSLVEFSKGSVGDAKLLTPYIVEEIYASETLADLMGSLCANAGFDLKKEYETLINGMNKELGQPIC